MNRQGRQAAPVAALPTGLEAAGRKARQVLGEVLLIPRLEEGRVHVREARRIWLRVVRMFITAVDVMDLPGDGWRRIFSPLQRDVAMALESLRTRTGEDLPDEPGEDLPGEIGDALPDEIGAELPGELPGELPDERPGEISA